MALSSTHAEYAARYERDGYVSPIRVLDEAEAARLAHKVRGYAEDPQTARYLHSDAHIVFRFVDELSRSDAVVDAVEAVLGPDVMLLRASFFYKEPHSPGHVTWHQDLTYWGLDRDEEVTAWIALSPASEAHGCMRFLPGSHRHGIVDHVDTDDSSNLLSRSQVVKVEVDESEAVLVPLAPGEMSLHHGQLYHASGPNRTDEWRIGLAVRYVTPRMRQVVGDKDHASLLRGKDDYGHFIEPPRPATDLDPATLAYFDAALESKKAFLYQGQERA